MLNDLTLSVLGTVLKSTAKTALEGISFVGDKVAEYSDEAKEYLEELDKKDTSGREARAEKRKNS